MTEVPGFTAVDPCTEVKPQMVTRDSGLDLQWGPDGIVMLMLCCFSIDDGSIYFLIHSTALKDIRASCRQVMSAVGVPEKLLRARGNPIHCRVASFPAQTVESPHVDLPDSTPYHKPLLSIWPNLIF